MILLGENKKNPAHRPGFCFHAESSKGRVIPHRLPIKKMVKLRPHNKQKSPVTAGLSPGQVTLPPKPEYEAIVI